MIVADRVANHFDVRWVDGYSAVSDAPSSLAAVIEKLAAELPSSDDRIELAVREVRRSDGSVTAIGLLRFVVAVSSAPRPLGFLHAAVLPPGYRVDLDGWRALVARRYGAHPEERIRTLYEELAESTKDTGRDRLLALAICADDVHELLELLDDAEPPLPPNIPRAHTRPGSRPRGAYPRPASSPGAAAGAAPAGPRLRPSQSVLPLSVRVVDLPSEPPLPPAPEPVASATEEMRAQQAALGNDVTQPMPAPSGTAAPISGEHPRHRGNHRLHEERGQPAWWAAGAVIGTLTLLLGAVGWLGYRHLVVLGERDRLVDRLSRGAPDRDAWERDRTELERVKRQLDEQLRTAQSCQRQIDAATQSCVDSLGQAREQARTNGDRASQLAELVQLRNNELTDANSKLTKLKSDLTALTNDKAEAERLYHDEQKRDGELLAARDAELKRLRTSLEKRDEQLRLLCKGLQSARDGDKPPKECQGIK